MLKSIAKSLLFISLLWVVYGFTIPNYEWYITDKVGVFSETQKADLNAKIQEIEQATSIEIAILVVPTVDDDINLAAVDVGNQWWVGKKGQNNGLMLLIAVDDKKWSIQVGYGLEGILPDLTTKRIGEARFPPNFKQGDYYQGILQMLDDVLWYIKQDPALLQAYSQETSQTSNTSFSDKSMIYIFFLFVFLISAFGRRITIPSLTGKWRKMRKYGRFIYAGVGIILSFFVTWIIASFVISLVVSYVILLFGILMWLYGKTGIGWWPLWFGWGSGFWWGSSFWWFGGGSFGGGWSSWSR